MNIIFKTITIHHFLSFGDATINLQDRGFCLVSGINRNPKDAAKSNGSGKSTIWNAISYVLTGETLQGLKSNLANIYFNDGCWVSLEFSLDGHEYKLIRSKEDKVKGTNLKLIIDGEDKSGKGVQESEKILAQLLPDITSELIGSVVILGQGMPQKFTNNTPAKRKEILEHLSKSDFMIQDLKARVEKRQLEVSGKISTCNENIISLDSKITVYKQQKEKAEAELAELSKENNYDKQIEDLNKVIEEVKAEESAKQTELDKYNEDLGTITETYMSFNKKKQEALDVVRNQHDEAVKEFNSKINELTSKKYALQAEITRLESIKDVCPTCGQKIPGAVKPDTTKQHEELDKLNEDIIAINKEVEYDNTEYGEVLTNISKKFDTDISDTKAKIDDLNVSIKTYTGSLYELTNKRIEHTSSLNRIVTLKENYNSNLTRVKSSIETLDKQISESEIERNKYSDEAIQWGSHSDVLSKMSTYLKRDFRGFLLENVISYIDKTAKEYASQIFGSNELEFKVDGNNIDISYCGKDYENLSGGEKQRVDLVVQFALRKMLCNYLGFNSNILVLDEITDNLDSISCDKVLGFITGELSAIDSVFIISHHASELDIPSDSEIIVEKNVEGVSEVI